ncbi:hypothetical protein V2J09_017066 [Rumex salicifolius]
MRNIIGTCDHEHMNYEMVIRTRDFFTAMHARGKAAIKSRAFFIALDSILPKVTPLMNVDLIMSPTVDEIRSALFMIHLTKAPGIDGMHTIFYQKFWPIILLSSFNNGGLKDINKTVIALIPKVDSPKYAAEFRPISLCNVIYKVISKMLASRMKGCLPWVISESQIRLGPSNL